MFAFLSQLLLYLLNLDPVILLFNFSHFVTVLEEAHDVKLLLIKVVIQVLVQLPEVLILELARLQLRRLIRRKWLGQRISIRIDVLLLLLVLFLGLIIRFLIDLIRLWLRLRLELRLRLITLLGLLVYQLFQRLFIQKRFRLEHRGREAAHAPSVFASVGAFFEAVDAWPISLVREKALLVLASTFGFDR